MNALNVNDDAAIMIFLKCVLPSNVTKSVRYSLRQTIFKWNVKLYSNNAYNGTDFAICIYLGICGDVSCDKWSDSKFLCHPIHFYAKEIHLYSEHQNVSNEI